MCSPITLCALAFSFNSFFCSSVFWLRPPPASPSLLHLPSNPLHPHIVHIAQKTFENLWNWNVSGVNSGLEIGVIIFFFFFISGCSYPLFLAPYTVYLCCSIFFRLLWARCSSSHSVDPSCVCIIQTLYATCAIRGVSFIFSSRENCAVCVSNELCTIALWVCCL